MRAAYSLALAHRAGVTQQRAQRAPLDSHVGPEEVLPVVVEEHPADRRLEERHAALVAGRRPGVLPLPVVAGQRRRERRQQGLEVALDRGRDPAADEGRSVLEQPDELIGERRHLDRDVGGAAIGHQVDGDGGVPGPERAQQLGGLVVRAAVVVAEGPVDQHAVEGGVRGDGGRAVLAGVGLDHVDAARLELVRQGANRPSPGRRRVGELVVHHQHPPRLRPRDMGDHERSFAL